MHHSYCTATRVWDGTYNTIIVTSTKQHTHGVC